ncbi:flagellar hook-associated protein 1 FlgK [Georgenia satyanarayanai]|uniref:Flagellar hook-associated protein 1 n=1 Tax=Georgenia satyanarayanai TaxID=860221 RepID=A0A2Y9A4I1_9MICO|nr:flagellar hook-associated protein FlgK [Georgenia satyanarayanai]PYG01085.1 flagellar hook-associated protein 1 FlgK [Georgenia satyanarayanai]SSA39324.1 flagellar hook-associated protein 1 FlgK [Georgenia satyanarayanai]
MSSFSALNGAFTALTAQRVALEVTGQNISNVNTAGYTRQRAGMEAITGTTGPTMFATSGAQGTGVRITSIDRLGDIFLETKLRTQTSSTARLEVVAQSWSLVETTLKEPGENGLAAGLDTFFTSWDDVANRPDDAAARSVLLGNATALASSLANGYRAAANQWDSTRAQADAMAVDVNTAAVAVADLNGRIRDAQVSGNNANALIDQRGVLLDGLAAMVGGEVRERADGSVDVMISGNALVRGDRSYAVAVHGSATLANLTSAGTEPAEGWGSQDGPARLVWAATGNSAASSGGRVVGLIDSIAPDGPVTGLARTYDEVATTLATEVNALHSSVPGADGSSRDFFALSPAGTPPALSLSVAVTRDQVVAGNPGEIDGTLAARIAELGSAREQWASAVTQIGVSSGAAYRRAQAAESTRTTAESQLLSQTAVDLDEESVNLVMYQRAYEASARVITTIDQMLDTLINRTGVVGR